MRAADRETPVRRLHVTVEGTVQGVGFRPFVHRLAHRLGLGGTVRNTSGGVELQIEGPPRQLERFLTALRDEAPPLAVIRALNSVPIEPVGGPPGLTIESSSAGGAARAMVPPDVATCEACLREVRDPDDPRHGYPFINCTDCGPRYTIIRAVPYDRHQTTMASFALCARCRAEYDDITTRRYHAQPVACPECGPRVTLVDRRGQPMAAIDPVARARELLREGGQIGAIKGLGGFHLACDAGRADAVGRLRRRKGRPHRPLAVMARDLDAARALARVGSREAELLASWRRPIVLLDLLPGSEQVLALEQVCGSSDQLGLMLPYTPLHHLLLADDHIAPLVMTSGNRSGEPIVHDDRAALERLSPIADFFLLHDRPILVRTDDSVLRPAQPLEPVVLRRSRGYVPQPIELPHRPGGDRAVLAVGGDLKGTCCITRGAEAIPSQYVGDLQHPEASQVLEATVEHLRGLFGVAPELVVHDLHPDYHSTRLAEELARRWDVPRLAVQHHHAHGLACLADNGHVGPALVLALDGQGHGTDGAVWGGELLRVDGLAWERLAHLRYLPQPGGDRAAEEPWRMALAALLADPGDEADPTERWSALPCFREPPAALVQGVTHLLCSAAPTPRTSSAGRLFDAVAAICGLRQRVSFEGQAAMELERAAAGGTPFGRPRGWRLLRDGPGPMVLDLLPAMRRAAQRVLAGDPPAEVARGWHHVFVAALVELTAAASQEQGGLTTVALSGGVLQNRIVARGLAEGLRGRGLTVLLHRHVSPNDGGLCLGQALAGVLQLAGGESGAP